MIDKGSCRVLIVSRSPGLIVLFPPMFGSPLPARVSYRSEFIKILIINLNDPFVFYAPEAACMPSVCNPPVTAPMTVGKKKNVHISVFEVQRENLSSHRIPRFPVWALAPMGEWIMLVFPVSNNHILTHASNLPEHLELRRRKEMWTLEG